MGSSLLFSFLAFCVCFFPLGAMGADKEIGNGKKPNILFIFADDLSYNSVGSGSEGEVKTPRLDSLKEQGCSFTHAFNPGSWTPAVCVASRTMLETGRPVWQAAKFKPSEEKDAPLWSSLMKEAGYETYFAGKWHVNGLTPNKLFDHTGTVRGGMPGDSEDCYNRKFIPGQPDKWQPDDPSYGGYWKGGKHWSEVTAEEACGFLKQAGMKRNKPFFMYIAFNAPHDNRQSPKKYLDMYPLDKVLLPKAFLPEYPFCEKLGSGKKLRDERLSPFPRTDLSIKTNRKEYYALISHLDDQIGKVLDQLKKSVKEPTYVIFTADQGLSVGDHGFMGKQNLYDPSIRVPFFIVGPDVPAGSEVNTPIYLQSARTTCLELAGHKEEAPFFQSLSGMMREGKGDDDVDIYGGLFGLQRMIRTREWKMLLYPGADTVRLYHRSEDPDELNDLAGDPRYVPVMEDLYNRFKALQEKHADTLNLDKTFNTFVDKVRK